ncbi:MAG: radical SAM protein, partial [Candidatus Altiarchaeota archaeon]
MKDYYKRALWLILKKPRKIPALIRLQTGVKTVSMRKKKDGASKPPISIGIAVTYRCNLRCIQCPQWGESGWLKADPSKLSRELTTSQFKEFIDDVAPFKPYFQFTGGEPLLREDIFEIIHYADSKNLVTGLTTNGVLLYENADKIVKSGLEYLYVSLDGPIDVNKKIRKGSETTSMKTLEGIKEVMRARERNKSMLPFIEVRMTVVPENQDQIYEMAEFVEGEIGPDVFCVMPEFYSTGHMNDETRRIFNDEFNTDLISLKGYVRDLAGLKAEHIEEQISRVKDGRWSFRFRLCEPIGKKGFSFREYIDTPESIMCGITSCGSLYTFTLLEPDGDIVTCASRPDYVAGNVLENRFLDIWNGERYRKYRVRVEGGL